MNRRRVATACLVVLLAAACTSDGGASEGGAPAAVPAAPGDFRVSVDHSQAPAPGPAGAGKLAWTSSWRLSWTPVPGATSYAVRYGTNEGAASGKPTVQPGTELSVEAAAGTSTVAQLDQQRRAALLLTSSQLLVSVSARSDAGESPRSLWLPVGDVPASGRPIGSRSLGEHDDR